MLVVALVGLLPFLSTLLSGDVLFASDQMNSPAWKWYFDGLRRGELPQWNPFFLGGMPTWDANAGSGLYPIFLILGLLLPITHVVTVGFVLHTLIAGLTTYVLVQRYFKLEAWMSVALSVAYMLNTYLISLIFGGHDGKFHILAWLPLATYFLLRSLAPGASWKSLLGLSVSVAVFVSTSHLQFTYYVLMGFFLVWLYHLIPALRAKRFGEALSLLFRFWVPIILGVGLLFYMFYPPVKYNEEFSIRGAGERTTYEYSTSWSMHPEETASLLVPEFGGIVENYWGRNFFKLNAEYPGLLVWFLALFGLLALRTKWHWFWGGVGLLAILYGLGAHTPVFRIMYETVPGLKFFRAPSMMLFWLAAALLMMSAETLRRFSAQGPDAIPDAKRAHILKRLTVWGYAVAGLLALFGLVPSIPYGIWNFMVDTTQIPNFARQDAAMGAFTIGALRAAALVGVLTWASAAFLLKARKPMAFGLIALAVTVVDAYWVNSHFLQAVPTERILHHDPVVDRLKADPTRFRVFGLPGTFEGVNTQYYGIETVDGFADHEMRHMRALRGNDYRNNPNYMAGLQQAADGSVSGSVFLDLLNVKYLAYRVPNVPGIQVVPNVTALPRAMLVPAWDVVDDSAALRGIQTPGFNPRAVAFVAVETAEALVSGGTRGDSAGTPAPVEAVEKAWELGRQVYEVNAPYAGLLVIADPWFPHWQATVNGKAVPLLRTNFAFRGVQLEAGPNVVEITYSSPWLRTGLLVSLLSLVVLALVLWLYNRFGAGRKPAAA